MRGRRKAFPIFVILFLLSLLIFVFSQKSFTDGITGFLQTIVLPIQKSSFSFFHIFIKGDTGSELEGLKKENRDLLTQLAKMKALEKDNQALRDQFAVTNPSQKKLLPAYIVGMPALLPGASPVDEIIIDKGSKDSVEAGNSIIFKDNLIGQVVKTSPNLSVVYLLNHKGISFTAKTSETSALGIIQAAGVETIVLNNVLLADKLEKGDIVVTKGDTRADGSGPVPDLVVGKIISVNKKASALFQSAEVERLVDAAKLEIVFVVLANSE